MRIFKLLPLILVCSSVFADNFVGTFSTNDFSLNDGDSRIDNAYYDCSSPWQCTFNYQGRNGINYSTKGGGTSNLTIEGKMQNGQPIPGKQNDAIPIYLPSDITIKTGSNLTITGFSSIISDNQAGLSIDGGSFHFIGKQGKDPRAIGFKGNVELKNGANLSIDDVDIFGLTSFAAEDKRISIDGTSKMELDIGRFENLKNFNNAGEFSLSGDFYNIGQTSQSEPKLANFNNSGTMKIGGNFYNGSVLPTANSCITGGCGGGTFVNEGNIEITGDFYNKSWQSDPNGDMNTPNSHSSVELKGGVLKTKVFHNERDNTLKFSSNASGQMGQLDGSLQNQGDVIADIQGADLNKEHKLITGSVTGLAPQDLQIVSGGSGANDLVAWDLTGDGRGFTLYPAGVTPSPTNPGGGGSGGGGTGGSGGGGGFTPHPSRPSNPSSPSNPQGTTSRFEALQESLGGNQGQILAALDSAVPNFITYGGSEFMTQLSTEINRGIENAFIDTQRLMTDTIHVAKSSKPIRFENRWSPTASIYSDVIAQYGLDSWQNDLEMSVFGLGLNGSGASGGLGGLNAAYQMLLTQDLALKLQANYAYADTKYAQSTLTTRNEAHIASAGGSLKWKALESSAGRFEADLGLYGIVGFNESKQEYFVQNLNTLGDYDFYSGELEMLLGYRLGNKLSLKPYVGVNNNYNVRTKIDQKGGIELISPKHEYYGLDAIAGVAAQYNLNKGYLYSKVQHDRNLHNSQREIPFYLGNARLDYKMGKIFKTSYSLGWVYFLNKLWQIGIEGIYTDYSDNIAYFGGSLMFKILF